MTGYPRVDIRRARTYPDPTTRMARTGPLDPESCMLDFWSLAQLLATTRIVSECKTDVGCWTPIQFSGCRRIKADATGLTALVFDVDQPPEPGPLTQDAVDRDFAGLDARGLMWFAHTSYSHGAPTDGAPRVAWRLIVPLDIWLDRPSQESAEHFALRAKWLARRFVERAGLRCVHELADLGRIWFWPAVHPSRLACFAVRGCLNERRAPARVADLMAGFVEPKAALTRAPRASGSVPAEQAQRALATLREYWPEARNRHGVSRHAMRLGLVGALAMVGYDDDAILDSVAYVYGAVGDDAEYKTAEAIAHTRHQIEQGANVLTWGGLAPWFAAINRPHTLECVKQWLFPRQPPSAR